MSEARDGDLETLERALGIPSDYGPAFLADGSRSAESGTTRRRTHLFEDCSYMENHALDSSRYETIADVPRVRWLGSTKLPPRVCYECDERRRHGD